MGCQLSDESSEIVPLILSAKKIKKSLAEAYPEIALEWDLNANSDLTPQDVTPGARHTITWRCKKDNRHIWEDTLAHRTGGHRGCPVCAGRKVIVGVNDIPTLKPTLAAEWHTVKNREINLDISQVSLSSNKVVWWICAMDSRHEWKSSVNNRSKRKGNGCPVCAGKKSALGFNDLASQYPAIAGEWHPTRNGTLLPSQIAMNASRKIVWQCSKKSSHIWVASITKRTKRGQGCPVCSGKVVIAGDNDLATLSPTIAAQWHPTKNGTLLSSSVGIGSDKKVWWLCNKGHEWHTWVYARNTGNGCMICSLGQQTSKGERELIDIVAKMLNINSTDVGRKVLTTPSGKYELDIYIDTLDFGIEFNGCYWHSELAGRGKNYHSNKLRACQQAGINLYQVWEDDWNSRKDIVIRGIAHRLGLTDQIPLLLPHLPAFWSEKIGARKTRAVVLTYKESSAFLDKHHIQGSATGTYYLGLIDTMKRLRSVLVISKTGKLGELSIDRYASAGTVSGGFTKLLQYAERMYFPKRWITFADLSISDGGLYEKTGFVVESTIPPDYSYFIKGKRLHKFNYRIDRFKTDPNLIYEEGLTETQLATLNGLTRIWDSGKNRYIKEVS